MILSSSFFSTSIYESCVQGHSSIVLFDGDCNFCDNSVQFIIKHDPNQYFYFSSLQSRIGEQLIEKYDLPKDLSTITVIEKNKAYTKSTAIFHIILHLNGLWKLFYLFKVIPISFRDRVYTYIATNRYKWFGTKINVCQIPNLSTRERFLN